MLQVLDLFSGIGGFSLGLERTEGFETIAFCECDPYARQVLAKHWPMTPVFNDVKTLTKDSLHGQAVDVITGGFPCQDVSVGHTWKEALGLDGERSGLWSEIIRLADEFRPKFIIAENVTALRSRGLTRCLQDLRSIGYDAEWHVISAAAIGADHQRERVWIIAYPKSERVEGLWPEGFEITRPLETEFLSIRDSNGKWKVEPDVRRMPDGIPSRVDRLRCAGNAVIPAIPELIGREILRSLQ